MPLASVDCAVWTMALLYIPETNTLFSGGMESKIRVWKFQANELVELVRSPEAHGILNLRYSPEQQMVLTSGQDGSIKTWRFQGTRVRPVATALGVHSGCRTVAIDTQGRSVIVASAGEDLSIKVWKLEGSEIRLMACEEDAHNDGICKVRLHLATGHLVSACNCGDIVVWLLQGEALVRLAHVKQAHPGAIFTLKFDPYKKRLLSAGSDGTIKVWILRGVELTLLKSDEACHSTGILCITFDPASGFVTSGAIDSSIATWTLEEEGTLVKRTVRAGAHAGRIFSLRYDETTRLIFSSGADCMIRCWREPQGIVLGGNGTGGTINTTMQALDGGDGSHVVELQLVAALETKLTRPALAVQFHPTSGLLLSAGMDGHIRYWRVKGDHILQESMGEENEDMTVPLLALEMDTSHDFIVGAGMDGTLKLNRMEASGLDLLPPSVVAHDGWCRCLQYDQTNDLILTAGDEGEVRAWRLSNDELVLVAETEEAHPDGARGLCYEASSKSVFSAGDDAAVKIWRLDIRTREPRFTMPDAHASIVFAIRVVDGNNPKRRASTVLSAGMDGRVCAWELRGGQLSLMCEIEDPGEGILALRLDAYSGLIVGGGLEGAIHVWQLQSPQGTHGGPPRMPLLAMQAGHEGWVRALDFYAAKDLVVSAGDDGILCTWKVAQDSLVLLASTRGTPQEKHSEGILAVLYHYKAGLIVTANSDGALRLWDSRDDSSSLELKSTTVGAHRGGASVLEMDAAWGDVLSAGKDGYLKFWRLCEGALQLQSETLASPDGGIAAACYDPAKRIAVSAGIDGRFRTWSVVGNSKEMKLLVEVGGVHRGSAVAVAHSAFCGAVITAGKDGSLRVWSALEGELVPLGAAKTGTGGQTFMALPGTQSTGRRGKVL